MGAHGASVTCRVDVNGALQQALAGVHGVGTRYLSIHHHGIVLLAVTAATKLWRLSCESCSLLRRMDFLFVCCGCCYRICIQQMGISSALWFSLRMYRVLCASTYHLYTPWQEGTLEFFHGPLSLSVCMCLCDPVLANRYRARTQVCPLVGSQVPCILPREWKT